MARVDLKRGAVSSGSSANEHDLHCGGLSRGVKRDLSSATIALVTHACNHAQPEASAQSKMTLRNSHCALASTLPSHANDICERKVFSGTASSAPHRHQPYASWTRWSWILKTSSSLFLGDGNCLCSRGPISSTRVADEDPVQVGDGCKLV